VAVEYDWAAIGVPRETLLANGSFIPENCAITGIKQWGDDVFVTVPRWLPGVPATLNKVVVVNGKSVLQPWPSYQSQDANSPSGIKYVQSMEIDPQGRMWILDAGFLNLFVEELFEWHTPRLIVVDIGSLKVLQVHEFPPDVAIPPESFLNDLVLDVHSGYAYISDARQQGGIIVYEYDSNTSWRWDDPTMHGEPLELRFCDGKVYPISPTGQDGIALSPDTTELYYCPLAGTGLFSVPTAPLRTRSISSQDVACHGERPSISDGLAFDAVGNLYYGDMQGCALLTWNPSEAGRALNGTNQITLLKNAHDMNWPDTFGFDERGNMLIVTNRLEQFVNGLTDYSGKSGANYRVIRTFVGHQSYMHGNVSAALD